MTTLKRTQFTEMIAAAPHVVWHHITALDSYRHWTSAFAAGSTFEGSWETGAAIRFVGPDGDGMLSEVAESRPHEFIAIRHLGLITNGLVDTTSDAVRAWAPAAERYTLQPVPDGTSVLVELDMPTEWDDMLTHSWPMALQRLKDLCESRS